MISANLNFLKLNVSSLTVLLLASVSHAATIELVTDGVKNPFGVALDSAGNMYIAEMEGHALKKLTRDGKLEPYGGNGKPGHTGDGGPVTAATFNGPHHLLMGPDDVLYIADTWNNTIRTVDTKTGVVANFAGTGKKGFGGDGGPADKADINGTFAIAFDAKFEKLYIADLGNIRVRVVDMKTRIIDTFAGNGKKGVPADGADAKSCPLADPRAVAVDAAGQVWILERGGHALRVVGGDGKIKTVAGTGKPGASGDGGPALQATLNGPKHLCIDLAGNVLIADAENNLIRKYDVKTGIISRVTGTGKPTAEGLGGPAEQCAVRRPHGVYVHPDGTLYISDSYNNRVLKLK